MAEIVLKNLTKSFGAVKAVNDLNLTIPDKSFVALLGPSGCGKSTTMNMIAGLEVPTRGQILFDGKDIVKVPLGRRGVGFVFQNYATFTHMSVYENLAFGLRVRGVRNGEVDARVREVAKLMRLEDRLDAPSDALSVNELQKLAIGRSAIVEPSIFLLDEPLSNLDAAFREFMRMELKHIQHQLEQTMVYVTHDQVEAMSLADRIAVIKDGVLQQYATPAEIYNNPANTFVAGFLGSPPMNQLNGTLTDTGAQIGGAEIKLAGAINGHAGRDVIVGIRPEHVSLRAGKQTSVLPIELDLVEPLGSEALLHARYGDSDMVFKADTEGDIAHLSGVGEVHVPAHLVKIFDAETGRALNLGA